MNRRQLFGGFLGLIGGSLFLTKTSEALNISRLKQACDIFEWMGHIADYAKSPLKGYFVTKDDKGCLRVIGKVEDKMVKDESITSSLCEYITCEDIVFKELYLVNNKGIILAKKCINLPAKKCDKIGFSYTLNVSNPVYTCLKCEETQAGPTPIEG